MTSRPHAPNDFVRTLVRQGQRVLIESTCKYCPFQIVSNSDALEEQETLHRQQCLKRKLKAARKRVHLSTEPGAPGTRSKPRKA